MQAGSNDPACPCPGHYENRAHIYYTTGGENMDLSTILMIAFVIIPLLIITIFVEYQYHNYKIKAGRKYRRRKLRVAGQDYIIWLPERKWPVKGDVNND